MQTKLFTIRALTVSLWCLTQAVLDEKLDEPMELSVLGDGRILFIQRKDERRVYSTKTKELKTIAKIPVSTKYVSKEGNLFPKDTAHGDAHRTRPEIYAMGHRNPFRISVDQKTGYFYWGEVGPDAAKPDSSRGPAGHDEVGQARKAGNFGWPHFVGEQIRRKVAHQYLTEQHGVTDAASGAEGVYLVSLRWFARVPTGGCRRP